MSPLRVIEVLPPGGWNGPAADHVTLDHQDRHRRRIVLAADHGTPFLIDFPQSRVLQGGCALRLEDGRLITVIARPEPLLEVRAQDSRALLRLAWHIGNRHLTAQVEADRILIRRDPVIAAMLLGLGATLADIEAPFDPEGGAYDGERERSHGHGEGHAHSHGDGHVHSHGA